MVVKSGMVKQNFRSSTLALIKFMMVSLKKSKAAQLLLRGPQGCSLLYGEERFHELERVFKEIIN